MSVRRLLAAAGVLLALAGCSSSKPTMPVPSIPLSSLLVIPGADTLLKSENAAFTVSAVDTGGVIVPSPIVGWSSSNTAVITVSSGGVVMAVGEGTATVQASSGGLTATAPVLVLASQRGWFAQPSNVSSYNLNGVYFQPDGNSGWAVGALGKIVHTTNAGALWAQQSSTVSNPLNSVWFTSATDGWIAGDGGRVLHTTDAGTNWAVVPAGTTDHLNGIVFATPDTGWAVGANGTILRTFDRGATWTRTSVTSSALRGVSFAGTLDGWAVGDNGVIVGTHDRGLTWFVVQPSLTSLALRGVWRSSASAASAVGDAGTVPRTAVTPDSVAWLLGSNVGAYNLNGVHFIDTLHGWIVGVNGTSAIVMTTSDGGANWNPQTTVVSGFALNAVWFVDSLRGWAVGNNGSILHTSTGGEP